MEKKSKKNVSKKSSTSGMPKKVGKNIIVTNEFVMKNRYLTRKIALVALALVLLFASFYIYDKFFVNHSCFTFYLNVEDRDVNQRILSDSEVKECIDKVCIDYNTGYTLWIGQGGYVGDDKKVHSNDTFVLRINNLTPEIAKKMAYSFIDSVNSTACMIEENRSKAVLHTIYDK